MAAPAAVVELAGVEVVGFAVWFLRRCSPLERGGGGGSYEAPVRADEELLVDLEEAFRTFIPRLLRTAG